MDNAGLILTILLIILFFSLGIILLMNRLNVVGDVPMYPSHRRRHRRIGGCAGTRWGCCDDGVTAKSNWEGSNCPIYPSNPVGGCAGTRYGCCEDGVTAKQNSAGLNCPYGYN